MGRLLFTLPVPPQSPELILDDLEQALAGFSTFTPVPLGSHPHEALGVGKPIDEDVALVVATSGSTGVPKGALLSPTNLVSSADATHEALGGPGVWLLALPAHHIAGIQVLVRSLVAGTVPISIDVSKGFDVSVFARAARKLDAEAGAFRRYTALVPLQLRKALESLEGIEALRLFDAILIGGAPLDENTRVSCERLGITVVRTYGSSETSGGIIYDGRPLPGARMALAGERVAVSGPMVARGYRMFEGAPALPASALGAFRPDGWFVTSDTGVIEDGVLRVTGRVDTVIDSGGLKLHPEVLEHALMAVRGVDAAVVVGVPDERLGQAICAVYSGTLSPGEVVEALDDVPRWQLPKHLLRVDSVPVTGPGKPDRQAVVRLFMES